MTKDRNFSHLDRHMSACLAGIAVAALWFVPMAEASEFEAVIALSSLDGATGFRFDGAAGNDFMGRKASSAGDVNGDGFDDVVFGAYNAGGGVGASYVVFGSAAGPGSVLNASALNGGNGFRLDGFLAGDYSGSSVAGVGDVNGDGFDDIAIGAKGVNYGAGANAGCTYVVFGHGGAFTSAMTLHATVLGGSAGFVMAGAEGGAKSGYSVAGAGDLNGDGYDDVIIGAHVASPGGNTYAGSSFVVFGKASAFQALNSLSSLDGSTGFRVNGLASSDRSGFDVSTAGDVNGDGFDDLLIGTLLGSPQSRSNAGQAHVVFGHGGAFPSIVELSALAAGAGFRLDGAAASDRAGYSVSAAGDVNGDGLDDIVVGALGAQSFAGSAYVMFGTTAALPSMIELSSLGGGSGFRLDGSGSNFGDAVSGGGDANGDGFDDIMVGARLSNAQAGQTFVAFGRAGGFAAPVKASSLDGTTGFRLDGETGGDRSGQPARPAGDVNGDGFGDMIVGAYPSGHGAAYTGSTYVIYGRSPDASAIRAGAAANQTIQGGPFTDFLWGVGGNDALEGRGGGDILDGSIGTNTASYAHAPGPLTASLALPSANTGHALGDIYANIQNLEGSVFADLLTGNGGNNALTGGMGQDKLKGGKGKDFFAYRRSDESKPGSANRDQLLDFNAGSAATAVDRIDLSAIDANRTTNGNQAFRFIGTRAFNGVKGALRLKVSGGNLIVQGDTNGNRAADFEIFLKNVEARNMTARDFKL